MVIERIPLLKTALSKLSNVKLTGDDTARNSKEIYGIRKKGRCN